MNAQEELLEHIKGRDVKFIQIHRNINHENIFKIEGTLEQALPHLNFIYDNGYGGQELFGTIWYTDGTWSERGEYDGSEWWVYHKCPPLPERAIEKPKTPHIEVCDGCGNAVNVDSGLVVSRGDYGA